MKAYAKKYITTGSNMTSTYFCNCIAPKIRISILRLVVVPIHNLRNTGLTKQQGNPKGQHDFQYTARSNSFHQPSVSTKQTSSEQDPFYPAI